MNQREKAARAVNDILCKLPARKRDVRAAMKIAIDLQVAVDEAAVLMKRIDEIFQAHNVGGIVNLAQDARDWLSRNERKEV